MIYTNYYLSKYVKKYRVKSEIDKSTNDFCRDKHGELNNPNDIYIKCANDIKVFHYGGDVLEVYIPSLGRGHNIIKAIAEEQLSLDLNNFNEVVVSEKTGNEREMFNYDKLYKSMTQLIYDIYDTDAEVVFKVKDGNLSKIILYLKPQTSGASISPVSPKNLSIGKGDNVYQYSNAQIEEYKKITDVLDKSDNLIIGRINNKFISENVTKLTKKDIKQIKADMKLKQLKARDYIYSEGYEKEYLRFLEKEITEYVRSKR